MFSEILNKIMSEYPTGDERKAGYSGNDLYNYINEEPNKILYNLLGIFGKNFHLKSSAGSQGNWAHVPWIALMDPDITASTQRGYYVCYLFSADMKSVNLSFNQGMTDLERDLGVKKAKEQLKRNTFTMRDRISEYKENFSDKPINLQNKTLRPSCYEAGHAFGKTYLKNQIPEDKILISDLENILKLYIKFNDLGGFNYIDSYPNDTEPENLKKQTPEEQKRYIKHKKIERDPKVAKLVKEVRGYICEACGFDFKKKYGETSLNKQGFPYIEAHHIVPLSNLKLGEKRKWDPKNDFKVLCANCHRMIHKKNPPLSLEELKKIIN